ncbi:MAG: hypothetical protein Q8O56_02225 [Solirubrobacteraceae bacterium]|nr:hypothetical protein [Solirubrobacteraceae bacterium]
MPVHDVQDAIEELDDARAPVLATRVGQVVLHARLRERPDAEVVAR